MKYYQIRRLSNKKVILINLLTERKSLRYDWIGQAVGSYLPTALNKLYGFITPYKDCCKPKYVEQPNLFQLSIYGFCMVKSHMGYGIVNSEGIEVLKSDCTSVTIHDESLVEFVRNGKQFLYFPYLNRVHEVKYTTLKVLPYGIKLYRNSDQGLYSLSGKQLFDLKYLDIFQISEDVYKAIMPNGQEVLNREVWKQPSEPVDYVFPEVNNFFRVRKGNLYSYISLATGSTISDFRFIEARDFTNRGSAMVQLKGGVIRSIDTNGNVSNNL